MTEEAHLSLEDKFDEVRQLISRGKEKGFLSYEEVNDLLPSELSSSEDLDDLFDLFGSNGIELIEGTKAYADGMMADGKGYGGGDDAEGAAEAVEKTNDPVRMYLREMGTVPLLKREGEIEIAKQIERGQKMVLKALSRSSIVVHEMMALQEVLQGNPGKLKDIVNLNDDEYSDELLAEKYRETITRIEEVGELEAKANKILAQLSKPGLTTRRPETGPLQDPHRPDHPRARLRQHAEGELPHQRAQRQAADRRAGAGDRGVQAPAQPDGQGAHQGRPPPEHQTRPEEDARH